MNEVSIIIDGVRYDSVPEEDFRSCRGCEIDRGTVDCLLSAICRRKSIIFKKSIKSFEP